MSEFLDVARKVLERVRRPMRPNEIVSAAVKMQLFSDRRAGKTPHQTMKSKLSVDVRRKRGQSDFVRTAPGLFYLRHLLNGSHIEYRARPLSKPRTGEKILAFDSGWLPERARFQGVSKHWRRLFDRLLRPSICELVNRMDAELSDTHKQVLTYIMVTRRGAVLAYKRGNYNRAEDFLRGSQSALQNGSPADLVKAGKPRPGCERLDRFQYKQTCDSTVAIATPES